MIRYYIEVDTPSALAKDYDGQGDVLGYFADQLQEIVDDIYKASDEKVSRTKGYGWELTRG